MSERLLVVDDEDQVREVLRKHLENAGYEVETCANGQEALEKVKQNGGVDCILTDLNMPVMDGLKFLKGSKEIAPSIPIIIISGAATVNDAVTALKLGAVGLIEKPFEVEKVKATVRETLSLKVKTNRKHLSLPFLEKKWTLEVSTNKNAIPSIIELVLKGMEGMALLAPAKEEQIAEALNAALNNAMEHGNKNDTAKRVLVNAHATSDKMLVSIQDEGDGYTPFDLIDEGNLNEDAWGKAKGLLKIFLVAKEVTFNAKGNLICIAFEKE